MCKLHARLAFAALAICAFTVLAGCSGGGAGTTGGVSKSAQPDSKLLIGSQWIATEITDASGRLQPVVKDSVASAMFDAKTIQGSATINSYRATYSLTGTDGIAITMGPMTLMAGPKPLMAQETAFVSDMRQAMSFAVTADKLELKDDLGNILIRFAAGKPITLTDHTWICTGYNNGKQAVVSPAIGSTMTIEFGADGNISGSGSVNKYHATYTVTDDTSITIGPLAETHMAGLKPLTDQEAAYFAALPKTTHYEIDGNRLILWSGESRMADFVTVAQ